MAGELLLRHRDHRGEARLRQALAVLPHRLVDELPDVPPGWAAGKIPAGGLGELHQVLRELLQLSGLAVQHQEVSMLLGGGVVLLQKVHVVDDGGQGGLDVVGDVGDELGLQALALELVLHGNAHPPADGVQVLAVAAEVPDHPAGVHLIAEVPGRQRLTALAQLLELIGEGRGGEDQQQRKNGVGPSGVVPQQDGDKECKPRAAQQRPPDQGDSPDGSHRPPPDGPQSPPEEAEEPVGEGILPPFAELPPDADGHPPALDQGRHQGKARRPEPQGQGIAEEEVRVMYHGHKPRCGAAHGGEVQDEVEIQGQLFLPAGDDLLPAGLPPRGPGEIDAHHQQPQDAEGGEVRGRGAARRRPLIVALGPVEAVRGPGLGVVVEPEGPAVVPEVPDVGVPLLVVVIEGRPAVPVGGIEGQAQVGGIGRLIVPEEFHGVRSQVLPIDGRGIRIQSPR